MRFNKLSGILEQPAKADKSAMGTVNRPLRLAGLFGQRASIDTRSTLRGPLPTPDVAEAPTAGWSSSSICMMGLDMSEIYRF